MVRGACADSRLAKEAEEEDGDEDEESASCLCRLKPHSALAAPVSGLHSAISEPFLHLLVRLARSLPAAISRISFCH